MILFPSRHACASGEFCFGEAFLEAVVVELRIDGAFAELGGFGFHGAWSELFILFVFRA